MFLVSSCSCLCPIHWSHVLRREWKCSWSGTDRRSLLSTRVRLISEVWSYVGCVSEVTAKFYLCVVSYMKSDKSQAITNSRLSNALNEFWNDASSNMQILNTILTTDIKILFLLTYTLHTLSFKRNVKEYQNYSYVSNYWHKNTLFPVASPAFSWKQWLHWNNSNTKLWFYDKILWYGRLQDLFGWCSCK